MQNSMVMPIFLFQTRNTLFGQIWSTKAKLKFCNWTNLNMQNVMVTLTFSVLNQNYPFWENSVQKIKIVTLS